MMSDSFTGKKIKNRRKQDRRKKQAAETDASLRTSGIHRNGNITMQAAFFTPVRRSVAAVSGGVLFLLLLAVYCLLHGVGYLVYVPVALLSGLFIFLTLPLLRNQRIFMLGDIISVYTFGKRNDLVFSRHLKEVVMRGDEILSYRFEKDEKYFQISPKSYYESDELQAAMQALMKKTKITVTVVDA